MAQTKLLYMMLAYHIRLSASLLPGCLTYNLAPC